MVMVRGGGREGGSNCLFLIVVQFGGGAVADAVAVDLMSCLLYWRT